MRFEAYLGIVGILLLSLLFPIAHLFHHGRIQPIMTGAVVNMTGNSITATPSFNASDIHYSTLIAARAACAVCTLLQINISEPYGIVSNVVAESHAYYPYEDNGTLYVYNVSITKATPKMGIDIDGYNFTGQGSFNLPIAVINGKVGVDGSTTYPVCGSIGANNLNDLSYTLSFTGVATQSTAPIGYSVTNSFCYNVPIGEQWSISFDTSGNDNYSALDPTVNPPANIVAYLPITLTNWQVSSFAPNTPLAIGTANTISGNIIGFNAIAYQLYETCNLNNAEFFFANGTIVPSWLEGNYLNEFNANTLCTSASSPNALATSANILYWVTANWLYNGFLGANTAGLQSSNTIYLGWAGNTITTQNTLFNNINTGEAPQLSCPIPSNTIQCTTANPYGEYDDGYQIFTFYDNFNGVTLSSTWNSVQLGPSGVTYTHNNGIIIKETGSEASYWGIISANSYTTQTPYIEEAYLSNYASSAGVPGIGIEQSNSVATATTSGFYGGYAVEQTGSTVADLIRRVSTGGTTLAFLTIANPTVMSLQWNTNNQITGLNYIYTSNTDSLVIYPSNVFFALLEGGGGQAAGGNYQWTRARIVPPNSVLPGTTLGTVQQVSSSLSVTTPTASNTIVDVGQYETIKSTISGGTSPFTSNFFVSNFFSHGTIQWSNTIISSSTSATTTFAVSQNMVVNSPVVANILVHDSASNFANSIYSANIYVYNTLVSTAFTNTNTILDPNEFATFTANIAGGAPPYTYNFLVYNSIGLVANYLITTSSLTQTYNFQLLGLFGSGADVANVYVNDSATTNAQVFNSIGFTAENTFISTQWTASNSPAQTNNYQTLKTVWSGGASTYTANYLVYNSINALVANYLIAGLSGTTNSFTFQLTSGMGTGTFTANLIMMDSATVPNTITNSLAFTVNPSNSILTSTSWTLSNAIVDTNQYQTLSATISGGIASYTYNFLVYNSINILVYNDLISGTSSLSESNTLKILSTYGTGQFTSNLIVTDSQGAIAKNTLTFGVNSVLVGGAITPANPTINNGQSITLTANPSGGTLPYTINWFGNSACSGIPSGTGTTFVVSPTVSHVYAYNVIDSPTTNTQVCSSSNNVFVSNAFTSSNVLLTSSPILSNTLDAGEQITFTANWLGGTNTFTVNFIISNSITNTILLTQQFTGITSNTESWAWTIPNSVAGNTIAANVFITDNAYSPQTINSVIIKTLTVYPQFLSTSWTISSNPTIQNLPVIVTSTIAGGLSPYTYNILIYNPSGSLVFNSIANTMLTSNSFTFIPVSPTGTWMANVIVNDYLDPIVTNSLIFTVSSNVLVTNINCANALSIGTFQPASGNVYVNNAISYTLTLSSTSNSQATATSLTINSVQFFNVPANEPLFAIIPYQEPFVYTTSPASAVPNVIVQCIPLVTTFNGISGPIGVISRNVTATNSGQNIILDIISGFGMIPLSLLLLVMALAGALISFRADDDFYKDLGGGIFVVMFLLFAVQTLFDYGQGILEFGLIFLSVAVLLFWIVTRFVNLMRLGIELIRKRR